MKKVHALLSASGLALLGYVYAGAASAQDAKPTPKAKDDTVEVIVTAQKTKTVASKTPIALTVLSGEALKEQGVVDVTNLQNVAPSLTVGSASHGVNVTIRGVSTTDTTSKGDQGIVYSIDGVPIGRPQEMGTAFFDLERVEVLRGPQGTLYGKSSTGGAINVITNRPVNYFDASASVEVGNYDTRRGELMVNVPLTDTLFIRAAGSFNDREGYISESINAPTLGKPTRLDDENNATGRLSALWKFADDASLQVTGTFGHIGGDGTGAVVYDRFMTMSTKDALKAYYNPYGSGVNDNFRNIDVELNKDFGGVHLTYTGAHMVYDAHDLYNPSTNDPLGNNENYSWTNYQAQVTTDSHELRLSNTNRQKLEWVIGANYYREINMEHDQNWSSPVACSPSLAASCNVPNPGIAGPTRHTSTGLFGQANYHWDDKLTLTLGLRDSSDSVLRRATIAAGPGPFYDASGNLCAPPNDCVASANNNAFISNDTGSESATRLTWRIGAEYQLAANQMIYGSVATGYKAGGFNDYDPATGKTGPYAPEELTAYEIGYKGRPTSRVQFNSSLYYYDYAKYGVTAATSFGVGPTGPIIFIYTKSAPLTMYGWENELNWRATDHDTLGGTLALERAYFGALTVGFIASNQIDWKGKTPDATPAASGTAYYEHRWTLSDGAAYTFRLSTKYSSKSYFADLGGSGNPFSGQYSVLPAEYEQKAYTRSDLNLSYTSANGKYVISGFIRNLENKLQMAGGRIASGNVVPNGAVVRVTAPRTFGMRVSMTY